MNKEEYERKIAEIKANHTPAQARAAKLIKPLLISIGVIFALIFIALIFSAGNEHKPEVTSVSNQPSPTQQALKDADAIKWQAFKGVSDCELAYRMYSDYAPIIASLGEFVKSNPYMTHQEAVQWKQLTKFDEKLAVVEAKYPSRYKVELDNAIIAHGFAFSAGQYWRDVFSDVRNSRPINSEQTTLMQDDLRLLKAGCPNEFREVN